MGSRDKDDINMIPVHCLSVCLSVCMYEVPKGCTQFTHIRHFSLLKPFLCQQFAQCFVIFNLFYFDPSRSLSLSVCLSPLFCGLAICRSISQSNKPSLSCHVKVKNVAEAVLHYTGAPAWNHSIFMPTAEDRGCTSDQPCTVVNCPFK